MPTSGDPDAPPMLKNDIERFGYEDIPIEKVLISTIAAKAQQKFVDPFQYVEDADDEEKEETKAPEEQATDS